MNNISTIIAQSTPKGTGAIHIIRLSGSLAFDILQSLTQTDIVMDDSFLKKICWLYNNDQQKIDQAQVLMYKAPHSYTGENLVEIHTHGNQIIVDQVIYTAIQHGAVLAQAGEYTQRAYLNNKIDLIQAEAINDLIHSQSERLLYSATNQLSGKFAIYISDIENKISEILATVQAQLDFPLDTSDQNVEDNLIYAETKNITIKLTELCSIAKTMNYLRQGIKTMLVGQPNMGKSSILNKILGYDRAIVSDIAGTTRDYITESLVWKDIPICLYDTAGMRSISSDLDSIEAYGIQKNHQLFREVEMIWYVLGADTGLSDHDLDIYQQISQINPHMEFLCLINKADLISDKDRLLTLKQEISKKLNIELKKIITVSTTTEYGWDELYTQLETIIHYADIHKDHSFGINQRQAICLTLALDCLSREHYDLDILSANLQEALFHLNQISGEDRLNIEATLDKVFGNFCIGK